jgi:hypothetical protein
MKALDINTIRRFQHLAGINEITVKNPTTTISPDIKRFLDESFDNEGNMTVFGKSIIRLVPDDPNPQREGFHLYGFNWDDYLNRYGDKLPPQEKKLVNVMRRLNGGVYIGDIGSMKNTIMLKFYPGEFVIYMAELYGDYGGQEGKFDSNGEYIIY